MSGSNSTMPGSIQKTEEKKQEPIFASPQTVTITDVPPAPVPLVEEAVPVQRQEEVTAPLIQTEAQQQENQRLQALTEVILQRQLAKQPLTFQPPAKYAQPQDDSYKARKERSKQLEAGQKLTDGADEYTARLLHAIQNEEQLRRNGLPPDDVLRGYEVRANANGIDDRQLTLLMKPVHLNRRGQPATSADQAALERNQQFLEDYSSGDMARITPHLDEIIDEITRYRFSPDMMEADYFTDHAEEIFNMSLKLTALSDMRKQFPGYFEQLSPLKRGLLDDVDSITDLFSATVTITLQSHSIDTFKSGNGTIDKSSRDSYAAQRQMFLAGFREKCGELDARRQTTLRAEAERQAARQLLPEDRPMLSATPIGQGAYRYGLPSAADLRTILTEQSGLSVQDAETLFQNEQIRSLMELSQNYHQRLTAIGTAGHETSDGADLTRLMAYHSRFVNDATSLAQQYAASKDTILKSAAATLGFMAMKAGSYSGMVANLESEFRYTTTINGKQTLHTLMTDGMGSQYEGTHTGEQYRQDLEAKEELETPRLDTQLRQGAKKIDFSKDRQFAAILSTCQAYEDFLRSAQVPPCGTDEEKALYPQRVKELSKQLLAFKDRITARTLCYLNDKSLLGSSQERNLCRVLEDTLVFDPQAELNFSALERLSYQLRHNDFSNEEFNRNSTGVMLSDALKHAKISTYSLEKNQYKKTGGAISEVYIPKATAAEKSVFRRGQFYRPWEDVQGTRGDIDVMKGGIRNFRTTAGRVIDSHKPGRDMAVHRVDELLDSHVIASADQVAFSIRGKQSLGTKMGVAEGKMAREYKYAFKRPELTYERGTVDLADPQSLTKLYWLQTVDAICGSADRHPQNYFVKTNLAGRIESVTGIDNDMSFGHEFVPMTTTEQQVDFCRKQKNTFLMFTPVYEHAFPCVPKEIKDKVMSLQPADLEAQLRGTIRDDELMTAVDRMKALQDHFAKIPTMDLTNAEQARQCAVTTSNKARELVASGENRLIASNYFAMLCAIST